MIKTCYKCGERLISGQLVELMVIAPYRELASRVVFSIGKPVDSYPDTLAHHNCMEGIQREEI